MENKINSFNSLKNFLVRNNYSLKSMKIFKKYKDIIEEKNKKFNIISKNSLKNIWLKHFLDSILITEYINFENCVIMDIGSGAGLPGIPIKILFPSMKLFLIESIRKKYLFLKYVIEKLDLTKVEVISNRFENMTNLHFPQIDYCLFRAVKMKKIYYEKCFQLLKNNGIVILIKGKNYQYDIKVLHKMNLNKNKIIKKYIAEIGARNFILIKKQKT